MVMNVSDDICQFDEVTLLIANVLLFVPFSICVVESDFTVFMDDKIMFKICYYDFLVGCCINGN